MGEIIIKTIYAIAILPLLIFQEADRKFSDFLKRKNIYAHWSRAHSLLLLVIIVLTLLYIAGYR